MTSKRILTLVIISSAIAMVLATPALAQQTEVTVDAPETITSEFSVTIVIRNVVNLDSGQFDLYFDQVAVNVTGVDDGLIDDTAIPIDNWAVDEDKIRVLFNIPGIDGVSGSGSLATIHFETIVPGDCAMKISNGLLVSNMAEAMPASWDGVESVVPETATKTPIPVDATGGETPETETSGFGAVLAITGLLAVIYLSRRL